MNYGGSGKFESSGEINVIRYIKKYLKRSNKDHSIVFDVGANIGGYSKILLEQLPENVKIFSFEPSYSTFNVLTKTLKETPVNCFQIGFGETEKELTLYHGDNNSQASLFNRNSINVSSSEQVTIRTLDNFCLENQIDEIDFLKLDIEGNELNALMGATDLLRNKKIHHIQFEFGGTNVDSKSFLRDFWVLLENYQLYRIVGNGLLPIRSYDESIEIFYYANYFARLK